MPSRVFIDVKEESGSEKRGVGEGYATCKNLLNITNHLTTVLVCFKGGIIKQFSSCKLVTNMFWYEKRDKPVI